MGVKGIISCRRYSQRAVAITEMVWVQSTTPRMRTTFTWECAVTDFAGEYIAL